MIKNSSYYAIIDITKDGGGAVMFYDSEGNDITQVSFDKDELILEDFTSIDYSSRYIYYSKRLDSMLDPQHIGKIKPAKIIIKENIHGRREICFYDKSDRHIGGDCYSYSKGDASVTDVCNTLKQDSECKYDLDWMITNNIPIINNCKRHSCCIL